jgi:hypothetical protein
VEHFNPWVIFTAIAVGTFLGWLVGWIVYLLHPSLTEFSVTRQGITAKMNNNPVQFEIMGTIERIDSDTKQAIRKETVELELMNTEKYGTSSDILTVNLVANQPLIHSAYENHHTRELSDAGTDRYIDNKTNDVRKAVKKWQKDMPALTDNMINAYVWHWARTVVIPNVRRACNEKLSYYKSLLKRGDICELVKDHIRDWIEKNEKYEKRLDELYERSDIINKSTIFYKEQQL